MRVPHANQLAMPTSHRRRERASKRAWIALALMGLCRLWSPVTQASPLGPRATLKAKNDQVDGLLHQKVEKDSPQDKKNKDTMKQIAATLLDYEELAKQAMADHWD